MSSAEVQFSDLSQTGIRGLVTIFKNTFVVWFYPVEDFHEFQNKTPVIFCGDIF